MTTSAPSDGAFSSMRTLLPGTASSERWRRWRWHGRRSVGPRRDGAQAGIEEFACDGPAHSIHRALIDGSARNSSLAFEVGGRRRCSVMLLTDTLDPPPRLLCGPGPSDVEPAVLAAMRRPMLGHLDPDVPRDPRRGRRAAPRRLADARRRRAGAPVDRHRRDGGGAREPARAGRHGDRRRGRLLRPPDGRRRRAPRRAGRARHGAVGRDRAERGAARRARPAPGARLVAVVHAETSTGALHPLHELGPALLGNDALLLADCVTSLGGIPLDVGRVGGRLRVQLHAEVPRGAARHGAGGDLAARVAADPRAPRAGAVLPRPRAAAALLDRAARGVPPHGADPRHLRAARGAAARARGGARGALGAARRRRRRAAGRAPRARVRPARRPRAPDGAAHRGPGARRGRRAGGPGAAARRARDRGRRRARAGRAADVADRPDGPQRDRGRGRPGAGRRSTRCSSPGARRPSLA